MRKNRFFNWAKIAILVLTVLFSSTAKIVSAQIPQPPATVQQMDDKGREVTTMTGFDLQEFGGDDSGCTLTQVDAVELKGEVGSQDENCKIVLEWSLKDGDTTLVSGVYALQPHEWFRLSFEETNGRVRYVGTMWYVPAGWNAHMYAANIAAEWAPKNPGLTTIVGLSPTDQWVRQQQPADPLDGPVIPPPAGDSDGDGIDDVNDKCPGTPAGTQVDADGCPITAPVPWWQRLWNAIVTFLSGAGLVTAVIVVAAVVIIFGIVWLILRAVFGSIETALTGLRQLIEGIGNFLGGLARFLPGGGTLRGVIGFLVWLITLPLRLVGCIGNCIWWLLVLIGAIVALIVGGPFAGLLVLGVGFAIWMVFNTAIRLIGRLFRRRPTPAPAPGTP